uniref:Immunoglobulin domain-containing protein n=1 Tax=Seriola lalandi dorsalis TaxID=1841481 RepID=A0A3B4XVT6_SERLL
SFSSLLQLFWFTLTAWNDIEPTAITHGTGENAQLTCRYTDDQENNTKYLCKGENASNCEELIHTTESERDVVKGRYDIRDNQRKKYFYVYINNLSTADSGTYWCGSERRGPPATYAKIHLSVSKYSVNISIIDHNTNPDSLFCTK